MASISSSAGRGLSLRLRGIGIELVVPVTILTVWWFASSTSTSLYFPPLSRILSAFQKVWLSSRFVSDALPSLLHLAEGFIVSTVLGIVGGVVLGLIPALADALAPILEFFRALPGVALVPAAVLLLGINTSTQIVVIVSATVWPVLLNTLDGVRSVDPVLKDVAQSYRIGWRDRLLRIVLRSASPQIVAGMRTALAVGIIMIVFSEMVGSTNGIGYQLLQAQRSFAIDEMWATMLFLGLLGYLFNIAFRGFEYVLLAWHRGMRQIHD